MRTRKIIRKAGNSINLGAVYDLPWNMAIRRVLWVADSVPTVNSQFFIRKTSSEFPLGTMLIDINPLDCGLDTYLNTDRIELCSGDHIQITYLNPEQLDAGFEIMLEQI